MALEVNEIPKLLFLLFLMGASSYITVKIAGQLATQVSATLK